MENLWLFSVKHIETHMQPDCSGQLTSQILRIMKVTSLVVLKIKTLATWFRKQHPEDPAFSWTAVKALVVVIMWFSVVWALANCSIFALHPALTRLESPVSRHPLLLLKKPKVCPLHQFIPMFISYKQSMRQAAETSEAALASIAFCAWLSARVTWASKVLSFIGNNGWESTDTAFLDGSWSFLSLPLHVGKQRMTKPSHPRQNSIINSRVWICRGAG